MRFHIRNVCLLLLPIIVAPDDNLIQSYRPDNFKKQIEQLDGNFIMFHAPWCRFCVDFHPIWQELAELVNTPDSKFAIAEVDCTAHHKLCNENDITGYPTLLYFHKNTFQPVEYKGTRDLPSLTLFLGEVFTLKTKGTSSDQVQIYSGMAHLNDNNAEKFLSAGQHFVMFYASWCQVSQRLAPVWAALAVHYAHHGSVRVGKVNCMDSPAVCRSFHVKQYPTLMWIAEGKTMGVTDESSPEQLQAYVGRMVLSENHDPDKFAPRAKELPVARITEHTFHTFLEREIVFVNYFAPWCAHCMQLGPLWVRLGQRFQNESRVLIADVDCTRSKSVCVDENINGLPTLVLYKNKKIANIEHGSKPLERLVALVTEHLDPSPVSAPSPAAPHQQSHDEGTVQTESGVEDKDTSTERNERDEL